MPPLAPRSFIMAALQVRLNKDVILRYHRNYVHSIPLCGQVIMPYWRRRQTRWSSLSRAFCTQILRDLTTFDCLIQRKLFNSFPNGFGLEPFSTQLLFILTKDLVFTSHSWIINNSEQSSILRNSPDRGKLLNEVNARSVNVKHS